MARFVVFRGVKSYLQKGRMWRREVVHRKREQHRTGHRVSVVKNRKCYYIYLFKEKMEKLREKYGIRGYIYIYPDVFHAKVTQHLRAFIVWKICNGINSHKNLMTRTGWICEQNHAPIISVGFHESRLQGDPCHFSGSLHLICTLAGELYSVHRDWFTIAEK